MASLNTSDQAKAEIIKQYNRDPKNWHIYVGRDRHSHHDIIVVHPTGTWLIKEHEINPFKTVGFAIRMGPGDLELEKPPISFGLRPVKRDVIEALFSSAPDEGSLTRLVTGALKTEPVPLDTFKGGAFMQGPVLHTKDSTELLSEKQKELRTQLRDELERLLIRRYPQTVLPYL